MSQNKTYTNAFDVVGYYLFNYVAVRIHYNQGDIQSMLLRRSQERNTVVEKGLCGSLRVITSASHIDNLMHILFDGTRRLPPFIQPQKGVDWGIKDERAVIGHFQKTRPVRKLG